MKLLLLPTLTLILISGHSFANPEININDFSIASVNGHKIYDSVAVQKFYAERGGKFLWVDDDELSKGARDIVRDIGDSWKHGLNPQNYYYPTLKGYVENGVPEGREIETEILFSDAVIRYSRDISGMRISPRELEEDTHSWSRGVDAYSILSVLSEQSDPDTFIQKLLPQDDVYQKLSDELVLIVEDLAKHPEKNLKKAKFPGTLKPGARSPSILTIRQRLGLDANSDVYDAELQKKVVEFQSLHGLAPDGIIGPRSFDALNQTRTQKLVKLIANLERRRWVRRPMPSRYIEVNIPQMKLQAVENGQVSFDMPVIIGRDKRPTMSFVDDIVGIRFNPKWYVPDTIKNEDFLPALRKDPNALQKKGIMFRVKSDEGMKTVAATDINWNEMNEDGLKSIQMYQDSGEENALGVIRVLMPNQYDIYLHDTNAPELFVKDDRALSSGCVRVAEPRRIANFILGENDGWDNQKMEKYIASHKLIEVSAKQPIPVYLFYYTAWLDKDNKIIIANDVYGNDQKLVQVLQQKGKIPFELGRIQ